MKGLCYTSDGQDRYFDSTMLRQKFKMSKSRLQKEMQDFVLTPTDYIHYKNQLLYTEDCILRLIIFIILNRIKKTRKNTTLDGLAEN